MMETTSSSTPQSLYRKWRSRDFSDVVGQGHVTQTLRNAVRANALGHAYLFTGPRGTGKTSTARILARAVNCLTPRDGEPCNQCAPCQAMLASRCLDIIEIDAASHNSVDDVRDLREKVNFAPSEVKRKVYIIDEVHMLSTSAFNALLKTLEEPPAHVLFVLATTDVHKVPVTITSRCQRLDFRTISPRDIVARLAYVCAQEGLAADEAALSMIAQQATGSLRDALGLLDQVRAYEGAAIGVAEVEEALGLARRETLASLTENIVAGDVGAALSLVGELAAAGTDMRQYTKQLVQYWRDLLLLRAGGAAALGRAPDEQMAGQAGRLAVSDVTAILKSILQPDYSGRRSASAQWQLELAIADACQHFAPPDGRAPSRDTMSAVPTTRREERSAPMATAPVPAPSARATAPVPATDSHDGSPTVGPWLDPEMDVERAAHERQPAWFAGNVQGTAQGTDSGSAQPMPAGAAGMTLPALTETVETAAGATTHDGAMPVSSSPIAESLDDTDAATATAPQEANGSRSTPRGSAMDGRSAQQIWFEAQQAMSGKRMIVALFNGSCTPVGVEDGVFTLAFYPHCTFHREQVEKSSNRAVVEEALRTVLGRAVSLRCVTMKEAPAATRGPSGTASESFVDKAARDLRAVHVERNTP